MLRESLKRMNLGLVFCCLGLMLALNSPETGAAELPLTRINSDQEWHSIESLAYEPLLGSFLVYYGEYDSYSASGPERNLLARTYFHPLFAGAEPGAAKWEFRDFAQPIIFRDGHWDWGTVTSINPVTFRAVQIYQEWVLRGDNADYRCRLVYLDPLAPRAKIQVHGGTNNHQRNQIRSLIHQPDGRRLILADNKGHLLSVEYDFFESPRAYHQYLSQVREDGGPAGPDPTGVRLKKDEGRRLTFSPDGSKLAVGLKSGRVRIYSLPSWDLQQQYEGHKKAIGGLAYHPSGKWLITGGEDKQVIVWDTEQHGERSRIQLPAKVRNLGASPDGFFFAVSTSDKWVRLYEFETGNLIGEVKTSDEAKHLQFHPLGDDLALADDDDHVYRIDLMAVNGVSDAIAAWRENPSLSGTPKPDLVRAALDLRDLIRLENQYGQRLAGLDKELAQRMASELNTGPKGEFESQGEFQARIEAAERLKRELTDQYGLLKASRHNEFLAQANSICQKTYSCGNVQVTLGQYNADAEQFPINIQTHFLGQPLTKNTQFKIARAQARQLKENWDQVEFLAQVKLKTRIGSPPPRRGQGRALLSDRCRLAEVALRDKASNNYYALDLLAESPVVVAKMYSAGLPPNLQATVTFEDPSGNDILDAEEEGNLWINVSNTGSGSAFDVRIDLTPRSLPQLKYYAQSVGEVRPGETRRVKIPIFAGLDVEDGEHTLTVDVPAAEGFRAPTTVVTFPTRAVRPPDIIVADVGVDDGSQNGIIEPGEVVSIKVRVQNAGYGNARDVKAVVRRGDNVFLAEGSDHKHVLGRLEPGQYRDFEFQVYTNLEATGVPIFVDLSEGTGRFGRPDNELPLAFDKPMQSIAKVYVAGKAEKKLQDIEAATGLSVDVDAEVPQTKMDNPDAVAVVMGVFDYASPQIPRVKYARRDAQAVRNYLVKTLGYRPENILPSDPNTVLTAGIMKNLVRNVLPSYLKAGRSDVFVYFSGHGAPSTGTQEAFLVPYDCDPNSVNPDNAYRMKEFFTDLADLKARSLVVVLDACFSGHAGNGQALLDNVGPVLVRVKNPVQSIANAVVFSSSAPEQVSNWYPAKKHGLFTYFLLKGLQGTADANQDGKLTVGELEVYLTDENEGIPYWSNREFQRPQMPVVTGDRSLVLVEY